MRRTMHAVAILLAFATQSLAQSPSNNNSKSVPRSTLVRTENTVASTELTEMNESVTPTAVAANSSGPQFMQHGTGRPYSQLGAFMQCNDWRPNLWDGYQCERAAVVSRISQHVDMTCRCFHCRSKLHSSACEPCAGGCGSDCSGLACKLGAVKKVRNRYLEPMSTLCTTASDSCGSTCGQSACGQSACGSCETGSGCAQGSCGSLSMQQTSTINATQVAVVGAASKPIAPNGEMILVSRDRATTPVITPPRAASNGQNRNSLFEVHR